MFNAYQYHFALSATNNESKYAYIRNIRSLTADKMKQYDANEKHRHEMAVYHHAISTNAQ